MSSGSDLPVSPTFWSSRACACAAEACTCGAKRDPHAAIRDEVTRCFLEHRREVYRYLVHVLHCRAGEAEDITQETFLRLYRARLDGRASIVGGAIPLLLTIAKRLAWNRLRRDGLERRLFVPLCPIVEETFPDDGQQTYEEARASRERRSSLQNAVQHLSELERECLHLRAEGQSLRTIAKIVGLRENGVSRTVLRAIRRLQQYLNDAP
jgi:RNA polymerase sigma factor (sigma-70 family)